MSTDGCTGTDMVFSTMDCGWRVFSLRVLQGGVKQLEGLPEAS